MTSAKAPPKPPPRPPRGAASPGRPSRWAAALRSPIGIALLVGALALAAHAPALRNELVFDDHSEIEENPLMRAPLTAHTILLSEYMGSATQTGWYRPVPLLVQRVLFEEWGARSWPYHAMVLLGHVLLAGLLAWLLAARFSLPRGALIAGALFAVHTVHTEAVGTGYGLKEVLAALFGFGALAVVTGWREQAPRERLVRVLAAGALLFLAVLSKESAAPLPAGLIASDLLRGAPFARWREALRRNGRAAAFHGAWFIAVAATAVSMRYPAVGAIQMHGAYDSVTNPILDLAQPQRLGLGLRVAALYGRMLVWPVPFSVIYGRGSVRPPASLLDPWALAGAGLVALLLLGVVRAHRLRAPAGTGAIWALATYLLASNLLLAFSTLMSERFLYLPSLGLALLLAPSADAAVASAAARARARGLPRAAVLAACAAPILALGLLTFVRTPVFGNDTALLGASRRWYPGGTQARLTQADTLLAAGKYDEAEAIVQELLAEWPDLPRAHERLVLCAMGRGDDAAARKWWAAAAAHPAADVSTYLAYAEYVRGKGDPEVEVLRLLSRGLRTQGGNYVTVARAREMRGTLLVASGRTLQGFADLRLACSMNPESVGVWEDLGAALLRTDPPGAEAALRRALALAPDRAMNLRRLADLLLSQRRGAEAVPVLQGLVAAEPDDLRARSDLGGALVQAGRIPEAEGVFLEILARDPSHPVALATLGSLRQSQGRVSEAAELYERFLSVAPADSPVIDDVRARLQRLRAAP